METSKEEKEFGRYVPFGKVRGTRMSSQEKTGTWGKSLSERGASAKALKAGVHLRNS